MEPKRAHRQKNYLNTLPDDVLYAILEHFDIRELSEICTATHKVYATVTRINTEASKLEKSREYILAATPEWILYRCADGAMFKVYLESLSLADPAYFYLWERRNRRPDLKILLEQATRRKINSLKEIYEIFRARDAPASMEHEFFIWTTLYEHAPHDMLGAVVRAPELSEKLTARYNKIDEWIVKNARMSDATLEGWRWYAFYAWAKE